MLETKTLDNLKYVDMLEIIPIGNVFEFHFKCNNSLPCSVSVYMDSIINNKDIEEFLAKIGILQEIFHSKDCSYRDIVATVKAEMQSSQEYYLMPLPTDELILFMRKYLSEKDLCSLDINFEEMDEIAQLTDKQSMHLPSYDQLVVFTFNGRIYWVGTFYPM